MNSLGKWIKQTFQKKSNIVFLLLSLIVTAFSTISILSTPFNVEKDYADVCDFPTNYSFCYLVGDYESDYDSKFYGLNKILYKKFDNDVETNIKLDEKYTIKLIGVDANFDAYPIAYFNDNGNSVSGISLEKVDLISGRSFTSDDITLHTNVAIMNSVFLKMINYTGQNIQINGVSLNIVGELETSNYINRHLNDDEVDIPIYVPISTLENITNMDGGYSACTVIDTKGYSFSSLNNNELFICKEKIDKEMDEEINKRTSQSLIIIISLFGLAIVSTAIVQYIILKNKHYEIGIKRAIGASQMDIVSEYLEEFILILIAAIILGAISGICGILVIYLPISIEYCFTLEILNINYLVYALISYLILSLIFECISLIMGTKINISNIIVEER